MIHYYPLKLYLKYCDGCGLNVYFLHRRIRKLKIQDPLMAASCVTGVIQRFAIWRCMYVFIFTVRIVKLSSLLNDMFIRKKGREGLNCVLQGCCFLFCCLLIFNNNHWTLYSLSYDVHKTKIDANVYFSTKGGVKICGGIYYIVTFCCMYVAFAEVASASFHFDDFFL